MYRPVYLTLSQRQLIRENCSQALSSKLELIKSRPASARVLSVVKVRHREYVRSATELVIERAIGAPGVLCRSIEIDWVHTSSSVYVLPFDGYDWRPTVFNRTDAVANSLDTLLLEQVVTDRFSELANISYLTEHRVPLHVFGVNKYIAIRTAAYPNFHDLLKELQVQ